MADIFSEVDEEHRQAQVVAAARRWWPVATAVLGVVLLVVLAVWGWRSWQAHEEAKSSIAYGKALDLLAAGKLDAAEAGFAQSAREGSAGYRALSLMQEGGIRLLRHRVREGADLLDQAARTTHDPLLADAASLEAALALIDSTPLVQTQARLKPLSAAGRPYRDMAREALALAELAAGQAAAARADLSTLAIQPDVSESARARAHAAVALIDAGGAAALPGAVKAALALPPGPVGTPPAALAARQDQ